MPKLMQKDGRFSLLVEGHSYLILRGQIGNSSAWPSTLPQVWLALEAMHANTVEAPVYWEQMEPQPGHYDFSNVDALLHGARAHNLHVVLLWFGTWKNGNMHYVPKWIKTEICANPEAILNSGPGFTFSRAVGKSPPHETR
jgi:beta-galactosidase GanA